MNEAIEKMARQAGLTHHEFGERMWTTEQCDGVIDGGLEAFAQAVAKRCADIARAYVGSPDIDPSETANHVADVILAEFGARKEKG